MTRWLSLALFLSGCGSLAPAGEVATPATGTGTGSATGAATGTATGAATGGTATGGCQAIGEVADAGETCALALDILAELDDSGGPVQVIEGNIHAPGDVDWYVINAVDLPGDELRGFEDFHLEVRLSTGAGAVQIHVLEGNCGGAAEIPNEPSCDEYEFFSEDLEPDETGFVPDDARACGPPEGKFNECADYTGPYLVRVSAIDGGVVCDPYVIDVSNGIW